jgi:hypothetical protein
MHLADITLFNVCLTLSNSYFKLFLYYHFSKNWCG